MRISDWSSDVCSSDLVVVNAERSGAQGARGANQQAHAEPRFQRREPLADKLLGQAEFFGSRRETRGIDGLHEQAHVFEMIHCHLYGDSDSHHRQFIAVTKDIRMKTFSNKRPQEKEGHKTEL